MIPAALTNRWRRDARMILKDPGAPWSLKVLASRVIEQWGWQEAGTAERRTGKGTA